MYELNKEFYTHWNGICDTFAEAADELKAFADKVAKSDSAYIEHASISPFWDNESTVNWVIDVRMEGSLD